MIEAKAAQASSDKQVQQPPTNRTIESPSGTSVYGIDHEGDGLPLPAELVLEVCKHLAPSDIIKLARASKRLKETIYHYHVLYQEKGKADSKSATTRTNEFMRWALIEGTAWHFNAVKTYLRHGGPLTSRGEIL